MPSQKIYLQNLNVLYQIPIRIYRDNQLDFIIGKEIMNADPLEEDDDLRTTLQIQAQTEPHLIVENENIIYGIFKADNNLTCIIGPVSHSPLSTSELYNFKKSHKLISYKDYKLSSGSIIKTAAILTLIFRELTCEEVDINYITTNLQAKYDRSNLDAIQEINYNINRSELATERIPYQMEKKIMTAIANSDIETLNDLMKTNMAEYVGHMANTPFKQMEYTAVSGITIFTRAAIEGGANLEEAYKLSDLYIQKVSQSKHVVELHKIIKDITLDLCQCVKKSKETRSRYSYIEKCKDYIAKNLYTPFTLDDIANSIGIHKCTLSSQFTKSEDKTITTFIHEERIHAAQNMLKYSDVSISTIANYLCFDSQSHFGSVFKKITGLSPSEYRRERKMNSFWSVR